MDQNKLIDTHCHLNFRAFENDFEEVIKRAGEAGVEKIINVGADLASSQKAIEIAQKYDGCYASVGIHPHHADKLEKNWEQKLEKLARQPKVVAIGEIGLDYYEYENNGIVDPKLQEEVFIKQIEIAKKIGLPLVIHDRKAHDNIFKTLKQFNGSNHLTGVFHCYSAGKSNIEQVNQLGFFFGLDGNLTYDEGLQNVARLLPLEKIILETDSPWLTPIPFRGQRNEPKNVKIIKECLAKLKNTTQEDVAQITTRNAESLFDFYF